DERGPPRRQSCSTHRLRAASSPSDFPEQLRNNPRAIEPRDKLLRSNRSRVAISRRQTDDLQSNYAPGLDVFHNPCRAASRPLPKDRHLRRVAARNISLNRRPRNNVFADFPISPVRGGSIALVRPGTCPVVDQKTWPAQRKVVIALGGRLREQ